MSGLSVQARLLILVTACATVVVAAACAVAALLVRARLTDGLAGVPGAPAALTASLQGLVVPLLGVGVALLLATYLLGILAVRATLRPVGALVDAASRASAAGDVPVPPGDDEVARLAHVLNAVVARMRGAVRRERAFVASAGDELRAPLAALRGEVELARTSTTYDDLQESLASAAHEVERLADLTDDLLLVAREGARADEVAATSSVEPAGSSLRPTDLRSLVPDELRRLGALVPRTALSLDDSGVGGVTALVAGPDGAWTRVLANLVRNAGAGGAGEAVVRLATTADDVTVVVDDDGSGFTGGSPPAHGAAGEDADHPGGGGTGTGAGDATAQPPRVEESSPVGSGTGLGLAIVDALVRARRGSVRLGTSPDGGGRVTVTVPLARPPAAPAGAPDEVR